MVKTLQLDVNHTKCEHLFNLSDIQQTLKVPKTKDLVISLGTRFSAEDNVAKIANKARKIYLFILRPSPPAFSLHVQLFCPVQAFPPILSCDTNTIEKVSQPVVKPVKGFVMSHGRHERHHLFSPSLRVISFFRINCWQTWPMTRR